MMTNIISIIMALYSWITTPEEAQLFIEQNPDQIEHLEQSSRTSPYILEEESDQQIGNWWDDAD